MDFLKNIRHRLWLYRAVAADVALARRDFDLNVGHPGPVLPSVHLLLHHHVQLVDGIKRRFVFVDVVLVGLPKTNQRDPALVLNGVAHKVSMSEYSSIPLNYTKSVKVRRQ